MYITYISNQTIYWTSMELSTGVLYKMLLRMQQLCENQFSDGITLL